MSKLNVTAKVINQNFLKKFKYSFKVKFCWVNSSVFNERQTNWYLFFQLFSNMFRQLR